MSKGPVMLRILETLKQDANFFIEFYKFAGKILVLDSLHFLLEVNEYRSLPNFLRKTKEQQMIKSYIQTSSKQCVNIVGRIREPILSNNGDGKSSIFDKAAESCNTLLEDEALPDFKLNYKGEPLDISRKKEKEVIALLSGTVNPDIIGAVVFLLTGQRASKHDLKIQRLNKEDSLKKWFQEGSEKSVVHILWVTLIEDLDPIVVSALFENLSPGHLTTLLNHAISVGTKDEFLLSEMDCPETILKEYIISVGTTWWTKVLKKNIEAIYKNEIVKANEDDDIEVSDRERLFHCIKDVITSITNTKEKLPGGIQNVIHSLYKTIEKNWPRINKSKSGKCALVTSKLLLDSISTLISTPSKALFDVQVKESIKVKNFVQHVADGLRSLVEDEDNDNLNRSAEVSELFKQCREELSPSVISFIEHVVSLGPTNLKVKKQTNQDINLNTIGHWFASNATALASEYVNTKSSDLRIFLEANGKDLGFTSQSAVGAESRAYNTSMEETESRQQKSISSRKIAPLASSASVTSSSSRLTGTTNLLRKAGVDFPGGRLPDNAPISELLKRIVVNQLKLEGVDYNVYAKKLVAECISTVGHLQMLPPAELLQIQLPVLIRYQLAQYCNSNLVSNVNSVSIIKTTAAMYAAGTLNNNSVNSSGTGFSLKGVKSVLISSQSQENFEMSQDSERAHNTAFSGSESEDTSGGYNDSNIPLHPEERMLIRKSWMLLHKKVTSGVIVETPNGPETVSKIFYSTFWDEFLKNDEAARTMFQNRSRKEREVHLNRILQHAMTILDSPSLAKEKIRFLGVQHCIWNIDTSSFTSMALAFSSALTVGLGNECDSEICGAWFNLLTSVGSLISDRYEGVKKGYKGTIYLRNGNTWKKHVTKMTEEALFLYKSSVDEKKPKHKFLFSHVTDIDTIGEDDKFDKETPYCFSISFGLVVKYFCVSNAETFKDWIDNITWRVKAYVRLQEHEQMKLTSAEMKKGKIREKKENVSKAEKAAQKVLRYRKHIDTQIKTEDDFLIFDNLVQSTIVIDTKGVVCYANQSTYDLFGIDRTKDSMVGKNIKLFMPESFATNHDSYINNFIVTGKKKIIGEGRDVPIKTPQGEKVVNLTVVDHQQTGTRYFIGTLVPPSDNSKSSHDEGGENFTLFDNLLQPTITITSNGIIEYVNPALCNLSGYTKEECIGKNVNMLMPQNYAVNHDSYLKNYLRTGVKKVIGIGRPVPMQKKDGTSVRCNLTVTEHFHGHVPFFMGTITEDHSGNSRSGDSRSGHDGDNQFLIFEKLLDATLCINTVGIILYANKATEELTGYSPQELISQNITMLMNNTYAKDHDQYLRNYAKTRIRNIIGRGREVPVVTKSGKEINVHLTVAEHESTYIGTLTQKKVEFSLYDTLLDTTIVINEQGNIQYCNNAIKKLLGYKPQAVVGKNVKCLMPKEYADKHDKYLKNYLTTGKKKIIGTGRMLPFVTRNKTIVSGYLSVVESNVGGKKIFIGTMTLKNSHDEAEEKKMLHDTRLILCDLANPSIVISKRGLIKVFNTAAEEMLGYKEIDILNRNIKMMMPEEYAVRHDDILKNYLKTGNSTIIGVGRWLPFIALNGEIHKLHLTLSEKKDKEGKSIYFIGILTKDTDNINTK